MMNIVLHFVLLILLLAALILAVFLTDLLRAAIALAVGSAILSIIFFNYRAPYAAVFELSVCAGLVMVLLVATIGLTRRSPPENEEQGKSPILLLPILVLVAVAVIDIVIFWFLSARIPLVHNTVTAPTFAETLWRVRWLDILGQLAIIIVGVFAILALFRKTGVLPGREHEESESNGS